MGSRLGQRYIDHRALFAAAEDGREWPNCGHPRTELNTMSVGVGNGVRCRLCRRKISRESMQKMREAATPEES